MYKTRRWKNYLILILRRGKAASLYLRYKKNIKTIFYRRNITLCPVHTYDADATRLGVNWPLTDNTTIMASSSSSVDMPVAVFNGNFVKTRLTRTIDSWKAAVKLFDETRRFCDNRVITCSRNIPEKVCDSGVRSMSAVCVCLSVCLAACYRLVQPVLCCRQKPRILSRHNFILPQFYFNLFSFFRFGHWLTMCTLNAHFLLSRLRVNPNSNPTLQVSLTVATDKHVYS